MYTRAFALDFPTGAGVATTPTVLCNGSWTTIDAGDTSQRPSQAGSSRRYRRRRTGHLTGAGALATLPVLHDGSWPGLDTGLASHHSSQAKEMVKIQASSRWTIPRPREYWRYQASFKKGHRYPSSSRAIFPPELQLLDLRRYCSPGEREGKLRRHRGGRTGTFPWAREL